MMGAGAEKKTPWTPNSEEEGGQKARKHNRMVPDKDGQRKEDTEKRQPLPPKNHQLESQKKKSDGVKDGDWPMAASSAEGYWKKRQECVKPRVT